MSELLRAERLGKVYAKGPERIEVLKDLELAIEPSSTVAVVGASGVGKTTLLHLLGAVDRPTSGTLYFRGEDLSKRTSFELARFRSESVGFVFQFHYLLPEFTAVENVAMPLRMRGVPRAAAEAEAAKRLGIVGLTHRLTHRPTELSGGEQQRVAIARALIGDPALLLADEPTGDLDLETGRAVSDLLFGIVRESGRALVVATHNPEVASRAGRVLRLTDGRLAAEEVPE